MMVDTMILHEKLVPESNSKAPESLATYNEFSNDVGIGVCQL